MVEKVSKQTRKAVVFQTGFSNVYYLILLIESQKTNRIKYVSKEQILDKISVPKQIKYFRKTKWTSVDFQNSYIQHLLLQFRSSSTQSEINYH